MVSYLCVSFLCPIYVRAVHIQNWLITPRDLSIVITLHSVFGRTIEVGYSPSLLYYELLIILYNDMVKIV